MRKFDSILEVSAPAALSIRPQYIEVFLYSHQVFLLNFDR